MLTDPPILAGVTLPRPSRSTRTPIPVEESVTLASGGLRTYSRGYRHRFDLDWRNLPEATAQQIDGAARSRQAVTFTDQDGARYTVRATPGPSVPVAGTAPTRVDISLTLEEVTPR